VHNLFPIGPNYLRLHFGDRVRDVASAAQARRRSGHAAGWTISGLATLDTIIAVWMFGI
jgi:hypothetical protein